MLVVLGACRARGGRAVVCVVRRVLGRFTRAARAVVCFFASRVQIKRAAMGAATAVRSRVV